MSFRDDYIQFRKQWSSYSLLGRLISFCLLLGAFFSLASIGEHVFKFTGFLKDGISLYQELLDLIRYIIPIKKIDLTHHIIILYTILISPAYELLLKDRFVCKKAQKRSYSEWTKYVLITISAFILACFFVLMVYVASSQFAYFIYNVLLDYSFEERSASSASAFLLISIWAGIPVIGLYVTFIQPKLIDKESVIIFKVCYYRLLGLFLLLSIVASISNAFTDK